MKTLHAMLTAKCKTCISRVLLRTSESRFVGVQERVVHNCDCDAIAVRLRRNCDAAATTVQRLATATATKPVNQPVTTGAARHGQGGGTCPPPGNVQMGICNPSPEFQPPRSIRTSSLVTLTRAPTSSSLRITDRSFWYASP